MQRREFLKTAAISSAAWTVNRILPGAETPEHLRAASSSNAPSLMKRAYGTAGIKLSIIGFSGFMLARIDQDFTNRIVAEAVEKGVNYFDVAPAYADAEIKLGPALKPYRKNVFLATKTKQRTAEGAKAELERSLERLKTDYLDLYQLHHLYNVEKDSQAFMKGGAMEVLIQAKKEGRVRHLGFSAHTVESALAAMDRYDFDSLLFPFNFASILKSGFGPQVLEKAMKKGVARVALKACVRQKWTSGEAKQKSQYNWIWYEPLTDRREAELGLRFSLSRPITAALPPMSTALFRQALDIALQYKPITPNEENDLAVLARKLDPLFPREEG